MQQIGRIFSISIFFVTSLFCSEVSLVHYTPSNKKAVMELIVQDPARLFAGYFLVEENHVPADVFLAESKKHVESSLDNELCIKKVLVANDKVIGFICFFKTREQSVESIKREATNKGFEVTDAMIEQIKITMPYLKKTDAECETLVLIETIIIDKEFQHKGYGRMLLQDALATTKTLWPNIKRMQLNVNTNNKVARKLYETEGFKVAEIQPLAFSMMRATQYEKEIS